jgi:hypothetical protein
MGHKTMKSTLTGLECCLSKAASCAMHTLEQPWRRTLRGSFHCSDCMLESCVKQQTVCLEIIAVVAVIEQVQLKLNNRLVCDAILGHLAIPGNN